MYHDLLEALTPAQQQAVTTITGPLLILAGPGSGKTRVVTHRVAYMLRQGISSRRILALTFTNKAADEMKRRLEQLAPGEAVWVGTFHRFCSQLLRRHSSYVGLGENFTIYDSGDSLGVVKQAIANLQIELTHITPERVQQAINSAKNSLVTAEQYQARPGHPLGNIVAKVYPVYQQMLTAANAVDFDDLLLHVAEMLKNNPELRAALDERYQYIMVDEYQDTNLAQYAIVRGLAIDHPNLSVTGDPDQSIYGWRGANLNNILDFEKDYPNVAVVKLEQNYRSTKNILQSADALIAHNTKRKKKSLFTENEQGAPVTLTRYASHQQEASEIASIIAAALAEGEHRPQDFAIFYRMNALSRSLENGLAKLGIPYQLVRGVEFYQRKEIKDLLGYLQLLNNPRDTIAWFRIINTPARGIGKSTIAAIDQFARSNWISHLEATREATRAATQNTDLPKRAAVKLAAFVKLYDKLQSLRDAPLEELLGTILAETGYDAPLRESEDAEDQERLENIAELLTAAREFDQEHPDDGGLEVFLENACLTNDIDGWETEADRVTLMTLHAAKGLEFKVVFLIGVEEGILPHERSSGALDTLEEERRLLFVGITRACEQLHLSTAEVRGFRGGLRYTVPSMFLHELPKGEIELRDFSSSVMNLARGPAAYIERETDFVPDEHPEEEFQRNVIHTGNEQAGASNQQATKIIPGVHIKTAAELLSAQNSASTSAPQPTYVLNTTSDFAVQSALPRLSPDRFFHGMTVKHPEYGIGKITALSGNGARRSATVMFPGGAGEKRFMLAHAPLQSTGETVAAEK